MSKDSHAQHGINAHGVIFDELHTQRTRELWDTLRYATAARRQPIFLSITTAGDDRDSICYEQHEYARAVLDGRIYDPQFLPVIYSGERGKGDGEYWWKKKRTWRRANPSLGTTISEESFAADVREAAASPRKLNAFLRYRLNIWVDAAERWLDLEAWDRGGEAIELKKLRGQPCYAGLDLSSTRDLTSLVLLFPQKDGTFFVLPWFWAPREVLKEREKANKTRYDEWAKEGLIELTEGNVVDYDRIRMRITGEPAKPKDGPPLCELYEIREIAIDPWNATHLATQLASDGATVIAVRQGYASLSGPSKELEKLVLEGRLLHGGHPVLRWQAGNVAVEEDAAGNIKPSKRKSHEKIDGIVALIMALARAIAATEAGPSKYESEDLVVV